MIRIRRALIVVAVGAFLAVTTAVAPATADTSNFTITSFTADYYLSRDDAGHSRLKTVETIVAEFPPNQNHGILRDIPLDYQGHPVDVAVTSVKKADGSGWQYSTESTDNGYLEVRIGSASSYVSGSQTFVITYEQKNVTGSFKDTASDEFYWDVNGTEWNQPFGQLTARVHLTSELAAALTGNVACYRGFFGSDTPCDPSTMSSDSTVFQFTQSDLAPRENVTFAIGFAPGTFVPRDSSPFSTPLFAIQLLLALVSLVLLVRAIMLNATVFRSAPGRPTIVAEYLPPKDASVLTSAIVTGNTTRAVAAQLVDLAVRKHIRIIASPATGLFASGEVYTIELVSADGLLYDERSLASAFFGGALAPGSQKTLSRTDTTLGQAVYKLLQSFKQAVYRSGYYRKVPASARAVPFLLGGATSVVSFMLLTAILSDQLDPVLPIIAFLVTIPAAIFGLIGLGRRPFAADGAELRDYLAGLKLYIEVAETDRIRILQSPTGAERIDTNDRGVMVKLYERVLPYAVLFRQEKDWAKQLGDYYDTEPPEWYSGTTAFNSVLFATSISSLSTTAASGYSGTSSSSSGGSGGGGSSGGGGGGGGGGGW
jgi:uncharacterized membrane protein YgcG